MTEKSMLGALRGAAAELQQHRLEVGRLRAVLAPRLWNQFVEQLRVESVTVVRDDVPLVEGRDFTVDVRRGIVTIGAEVLNGEALDVERADPLDLAHSFAIAARSVPPPAYIDPRRSEAQWKTERRGRRS